ncbi:MAG: sulfatase-like hydrolase/transferase [Planctomycetes bacterium]|nr:sulfatase-like hydrolase/transferase [Planctomycetota bacterium]
MMQPAGPNILIVLTDQQSHHLMSCVGTSWVSTPSLDRLAAGGARFPRAYCSDPVCVPSRFSMFTGRMPSAIGMRGNGGQGLLPFQPAHDASGLGHLLRGVGYETWYGGKVHWPVGLTPQRLGFEVFSGDERERLAVETAALIRARAGRRWAMVASLINPHDICYQAIRAFASDGMDRRILAGGATELANLDEALLPPRGVDRDAFLRDHLPPLPANADIQADEPELIAAVLAARPFKAAARAQWTAQDWRLHRWAYARLMERVDRQIGVILDALAASGQERDTLVIMTSDHGDHDGSHRLEHKTFFYEEAARVPWLMSLPGRIPAGRVVDDGLVATGLDLMATCCDYAGAAQPAHCRGLSQRFAAEGGTPVRGAVYGENAISRMVATRRWKYVRYDGGAHAEQLYDLERDPGETRNHAGDPANAAVLADLRLLLDAEIAAHAALAIGPMPPPGPLGE